MFLSWFLLPTQLDMLLSTRLAISPYLLSDTPISKNNRWVRAFGAGGRWYMNKQTSFFHFHLCFCRSSPYFLQIPCQTSIMHYMLTQRVVEPVGWVSTYYSLADFRMDSLYHFIIFIHRTHYHIQSPSRYEIITTIIALLQSSKYSNACTIIFSSRQHDLLILMRQVFENSV
jgi:hypothetical protein